MSSDVAPDRLADADLGPPSSVTEQLLLAQRTVLEGMVRGAPLKASLSELTRVVEMLDGGRAVAAILLLDPLGRLWTGAAPGLPDAYNSAIDGLEAQADLGTCAAAAVTRQVVITPSIDACPRWAGLKGLPLGLGLLAAWSQPIFASDGRVLGTFGTYFREERTPSALERRLVETLAETAALAIEREAAARAMAQNQRLLDRALEAAEMGPWRYDPADQVCEFSPRAQALYGLDEARFLHDEVGVTKLIHPEDIPGLWAAVSRAVDPEGDGRYVVEYRTRKNDGGWRWLSVWGLAEFEGEGPDRRAVMLVGASRDVSQQKLADRQRTMLIDELSHRVKNNLAIVQSMASQTLRTSPEPAVFAEAFMARLSALARAHNLLTQTVWQGADVGELARATLDPFVADEGETHRILIEGAPVSAPAEMSVTLALLLHELATNAAKYGALSGPAGAVRLSWRVDPAASGARRLSMCWSETGGPAVAPPARRGFGSRLIATSAAQLGGRAELSFQPEGLQCELELPLPSLDAAPLDLAPLRQGAGPRSG
jgi:two-component sensor histidine kinase/PAS domain-containing protein